MAIFELKIKKRAIGEVCERRIQASLVFMTLMKLSRREKLRVKRSRDTLGRYMLTLESLLTPSSRLETHRGS